MIEVTIAEASARFAELARQVRETGEPIRVVIDGEAGAVEIARSARPAGHRRSREDAFAALARLRRELPKSSREFIRADLEEGRR